MNGSFKRKELTITLTQANLFNLRILLSLFILCLSTCSKKADYNNQNKTTVIQIIPDCQCSDTMVQPDLISFEVDSPADPRQDFINSIQKGDCRFVGVGGFTLRTPGIDSTFRYHKTFYGCKMIQGTGDYVPKEDMRTFSFDPMEYAKEYNTLLIKYLSKSCKSLLDSL